MNSAAEDFMRTLDSYASDLSLLFAHDPDERARARLQISLGRLQPKLAKELGSDLANKILDVLGAEVMARKAAIERCGRSRA